MTPDSVATFLKEISSSGQKDDFYYNFHRLNEPASTILKCNVNLNTTDIPKIQIKKYKYNSSSPLLILAPWFVWIIVRYGGGICMKWFFLLYSWVPVHRSFSFPNTPSATGIHAPDHLKIESSSHHETGKLSSNWNRLEFRETFDDTRFCSNNLQGDIGLGAEWWNLL